jgi:MFS transporter, FHS family, L-fucose permease
MDSETDDHVAGRLFALLTGVYLGGGLLNSTVNLLVPRLKLMLGLDYAQALLVHLAYYSSYLLFALPVTLCAVRFGYMRAIAGGLCTIAAGNLLFAIAQGQRDYAFVLLSLLVMSAGVTFLQIAGAAVTRTFGSGTRMASRLTLLQAFNSVGTVAGPLIGAHFLLGTDDRSMTAAPFLFGAVAMLLLGVMMWANRSLPVEQPDPEPTIPRLPALLRERAMQIGALAIFVYVGAEVTIGTLAVSYLMQPDTVGLSAQTSGKLVSLYWAGAMIGRFAGAFAVRRIGARGLLAQAAIGAGVLLLVAVLVRGEAGSVALLAIGLCHSVMFPLIYTLALPPRTEDTAAASMILCMAVVGGAIVPMLTGLAADRIGLVPSLLVPGLCYAVIWAFAMGHGRLREAE